MLTVKKDNRVIYIDELEKEAYRADGYDVVEEQNGEYVVVEPATDGRTYTIAEYLAIEEERDALQADVEELEKTKRDALKAELEQVKTELETVKANLTVANARNGEPLV